MSFSALTIAMTVVTSPIPNGGAPASVTAVVTEPAAVEPLPGEIRPTAAPAAVAPLIVLAQSAESPQSMALASATEPTESTDPAQTIDPASPAQPDTQALPPPMDQGAIVVTGRRPSPADPLEELNATSFEVTQSVDKAIVAPIAFAYEDVMPRPIRQGIRNFLHNLGEPVVFLNFMLQLKPGKAAETVGRFVINTAVGAGGLVDVAKRKPFNLPHRHNGFANTLGYYGVPQGPYFYLPIVGPTTLRDFIGNRLDVLIFPLAFGKQFSRPEILIPVAALNELNSRIEFDDELRQIRATRDPYVAARSYYLRRRQAEIDALHGRGDGTVPIVVPAATSRHRPSGPASPAPVQDSSATPSSIGQ